MRELREDERVQLEERHSGLESFLEGGMVALGEFVKRLELPEPYMVLCDASRYLQPIDTWMKDQVVGEEDRTWIISRIGYFIAELLNQRLGGCWCVDDCPDSPYFLQYVIGRFSGAANPNKILSAFAVAANYVDEPPGRDLSAVVARTERALLHTP